ncbi:SEL1-like repeat protein [Acinetobacter indicus]|uniref:sel1 repeat family protein n=1 Tax=Acinetobacter indicus TaxID=756892 RepID=UPI003989C6F3
MLRKISILIISLFISLMVHSTENEITYKFSPTIQIAKDKYQKLINSLMSDPSAPNSISYSPELDQLLKENNEVKINQYINVEKRKYLATLNKYILQGDPSASMALLEFVLFFKETELKSEIDISPIKKLSDQNNAYASYLLAQHFEYDPTKYLKFLEKAGEQGSPIAQRTLVDEYNFRLPKKLQSIKKAEYWKQKAIASMGSDEYEEEVCKLANCDTGEFELVDFSKDIEKILNQSK